jgi:hypothetical protein
MMYCDNGFLAFQLCGMGLAFWGWGRDQVGVRPRMVFWSGVGCILFTLQLFIASASSIFWA